MTIRIHHGVQPCVLAITAIRPEHKPTYIKKDHEWSVE